MGDAGQYQRTYECMTCELGSSSKMTLTRRSNSSPADVEDKGRAVGQLGWRPSFGQDPKLYGWTSTARCAFGPQTGMTHIHACLHSDRLDLEALIRTRGASF
jgi:hypothetical protein